MLEEAACKKIDAEIIQRNVGAEPGTLVSALLKLKGKGAEAFANSWQGTVLWIGQSPYRKFHKRKNWYVGVNCVVQDNLKPWNEDEVIFQTLRSSGPGGQHVNKTESGVRAIHSISGIQVTASDSRSQFQNKKLALERLQIKIALWQTAELLKNEQNTWNQHNTLERGNPVRVFKGREFVAFALQVICLLFLRI
jgi:peptide chain release factor